MIFDFDKHIVDVKNKENYYFKSLDVKLLDKLYDENKFIPMILIRTELDLQPFLRFVQWEYELNKNKSDIFWNKFQFYTNKWFVFVCLFLLFDWSNY